MIEKRRTGEPRQRRLEIRLASKRHSQLCGQNLKYMMYISRLTIASFLNCDRSTLSCTSTDAKSEGRERAEASIDANRKWVPPNEG